VNLRQIWRNLTQRASPIGDQLSSPAERAMGVGGDWAPLAYGDYMSRSVPVYSAIKIRADAIARVPLIVYQVRERAGEESREPVGRDHPVQRILNRVNPFWTRGDLWRASETYLGLWGSAYWLLERDAQGLPVEIWPMRPDRTRIVPDPEEYIKGYVFVAPGGKRKAFTADEVVRIRYFNPMDEYAGLSPIAPARLTLDLGIDALKGNRHSIANDSTPGLVFETTDTPSDTEVKDFYDRWESRYKGPTKRMRPALLSAGMKVGNIGFSPRDMQHIESLKWTLGDVARVYNVPLPMLHELSRATYANMITARRSFWEDCIVPQLMFYQEALQEHLLPHFGDDSLLVEFDLSAIEALQEDENQRATRRQIYVKTGIMTPNEVRREMGLPAVTDQPEADDLQISAGGMGPFGSAEASASVMVGRVPRALRAMPWEERGRESERVFLKGLKTREREFKAMLNGLFDDQIADMLKRLQEHRAAHAVWREPTLVGALSVTHNGRGERQDPLPGQTGGLVLFDATAWEATFEQAAITHVTGALTASGQAIGEQFGFGIAFDVDSPIVQRWIRDRTAFWSQRVNETTGKAVTNLIRKANEDGLSIEQIAERLDQDIAQWNRRARSPTIARTEMVSAQNEGHLSAFEQAEIPGKQWFTSIDGRERPSHNEAHLQIRAVNADFQVGAGSLRAPGQGGPAGEVVNCRCTTLPRFEL
jgi:HK97 family phage portal protein